MCNKLSGCNNVLPPDKLLANPTTPLSLPITGACSLGNRFPLQRAFLAVVHHLLESNRLSVRGHVYVCVRLSGYL